MRRSRTLAATVDYNYKRNSVRLTSQDTYDVGSVWVIDALHMPYGCSVWPALWVSDVRKTSGCANAGSLTVGARAPTGQQAARLTQSKASTIQVSNQMALHTADGCTLTTSTTSYTGTTNSTNCYEGANNNTGCAISDGSSASYGAAFTNAGGGVWVTELAESGVS